MTFSRMACTHIGLAALTQEPDVTSWLASGCTMLGCKQSVEGKLMHRKVPRAKQDGWKRVVVPGSRHRRRLLKPSGRVLSRTSYDPRHNQCGQCGE